MDRINPTGIPRDDLVYHLKRPDYVKIAVQTDSCLLCRSNRVNEAGLCNLCSAQLSTEELALVEQWMAGLLRF